MRADALDFVLPEGRIATEPPAERDGARMLVVPRGGGARTHATVRAMASFVPRDALLVVNDTRVIPARLHGTKSSGGRVEVFLVRAADASGHRWKALGRASKPIKPGTSVTVSEKLTAVFGERDAEGFWQVELVCEDPWRSIERHGEVPLPPYMRRAPDARDRERYQTVYAARPGAVAAPTAGLHLTESIFETLAAKGVSRVAVTLHVGTGTFAPVTVDDLDQHPMHAEWYEVPEASAEAITRARREGRAIVAVGTTVVRTLESWKGTAALSGDTRLLIQPGYTFTMVDGLLTNFHLPRSTLLALVMAFGGVEPVRAAYQSAIDEGYRFYSYGDAMLLMDR